MAEKEKSKKTKAPKKKLRAITHHIAEDGGFVHEHHYHGNPPTSSFGGYSENLADLHQHVDDHLSPEAMGGGDGGGGGEDDEGGAGGGAPPQAAAGGGQAPPQGGGGPE
jgi:hypothetical protein